MLDRRTALWDELKDRKEAHDAHWRAGRILDNTYLLTLRHLGFTPREAQDELAALKAKK